MRKAGGSELYLRNSNVILRSLKLYNHKEEGSCVLREEEAGNPRSRLWLAQHVHLFTLSPSHFPISHPGQAATPGMCSRRIERARACPVS